MSTTKKQPLLEKYDIPLNHLDFPYIEKCENTSEIEKIVEILKSGEEGFYPDLTKCAEKRLKELNPNSKCLRGEEPIRRQQTMGSDEWSEITKMVQEFTCGIKNESEMIRNASASNIVLNDRLPAIRQSKNTTIAGEMLEQSDKKTTRIRSCDYAQWEKYDADTETLKIDLQEERNREKNDIKRRKNLRITEKEQIKPTALDGFSEIEKAKLAEKHRICGNEFFRSSDYDDAIVEYTKSINIIADARCFNNRALAYLKLKKYAAVLDDCEKCLEIEPRNIKALLRKAEALQKEDRMRNAYETYGEILKYEPENKTARKNVDEIKKQLPELPPANAFRLKIAEDPEAKPTMKPIPSEKTMDDLSKLIIPNKIVRSKLSQLASQMPGMMETAKADLEKIKQNLNDKEIGIFPHDANWNGASIEEIV